MVFSGGTDKFLIMGNDSSVESWFDDGHREYTTGGKAFCRDGVGVVTLWGARNGNTLIQHLNSLGEASAPHSVEDLARAVHHYLVNHYQPHDPEGAVQDTGYHVGGFTADRQVRLYQIAWNEAGSGVARGTKGAYILQLHHPAPSGTFLFNGRHDIANSLISTLINENREQRELMFPLTPSGVCRLTHFVLRVCAELTRQVSPPFTIHVLSPSRRCIPVQVDQPYPVDDAFFSAALATAGLVSQSETRP